MVSVNGMGTSEGNTDVMRRPTIYYDYLEPATVGLINHIPTVCGDSWSRKLSSQRSLTSSGTEEYVFHLLIYGYLFATTSKERAMNIKRGKAIH